MAELGAVEHGCLGGGCAGAGGEPGSCALASYADQAEDIVSHDWYAAARSSGKLRDLVALGGLHNPQRNTYYIH